MLFWAYLLLREIVKCFLEYILLSLVECLNVLEVSQLVPVDPHGLVHPELGHVCGAGHTLVA